MYRNKQEWLLIIKWLAKKSSNQPLITVITAVFNWEEYLEKTINKIINQNYPHFEYIIVDWWSTDWTIDIIKKYEDKITYWVSEKDNWIADAFNKWVKLSHWTYINFQWDGDWFFDENSLTNIMDWIDTEKDMFICWKIQRIWLNWETLYVSKQDKSFSKFSLLFRMSLPHQWLFTHKKMFDIYWLFDINNKYCMDYELLLRAYKNFPKVVLKNFIVANWRADWLWNGKILEILKEYNYIKIKNKIANEFILKLIHIWTLFKYYIWNFLWIYK